MDVATKLLLLTSNRYLPTGCYDQSKYIKSKVSARENLFCVNSFRAIGLSLYSPENIGFPVFSGGIEKGQWHDMIITISNLNNLNNFFTLPLYNTSKMLWKLLRDIHDMFKPLQICEEKNRLNPSSCRNCTTQKMKFSIKDFFSKWDQIRSFLRIWPHLLKKYLTENFTFCAPLPLTDWE